MGELPLAHLTLRGLPTKQFASITLLGLGFHSIPAARHQSEPILIIAVAESQDVGQMEEEAVAGLTLTESWTT